MLLDHLRTAWRRLRHNTTATGISIAGLAVGMTSALLVFLWVHNELSYDSHHPSADRVYRLTAHISSLGWKWPITPLPASMAIRRQLPQVEKATAMRKARDLAIHIGDQLFTEKNAAYVDSSWFDVFRFDFLEGNPTAFLGNPYNIALTASTAKKYFGSRKALGSTIRVDSLTCRVAAILKDNPSSSSFQYDVLMPLTGFLADARNRNDDTQWGNFNYYTFIRLSPSADTARTAAAITAIISAAGLNKDARISLQPLSTMHFETGITSGQDQQPAEYRTVCIFSILGCLLLIIACINYVNLTTAKASRRAKEVSIRKLIGAGRQSLFWQFITESLVISAISVLLTILLTRLCLPGFRELTGKNFADPLTQTFTWEMIGITLLTTTLLNGVYPALLLSSFRPLNVFRGISVLRVKDGWLRKALVTAQFTIAVALIIGTVVIQRQISYIQHMDPGFDRSRLFSFRLPYTIFTAASPRQRTATFASIREQLLSCAGITDMSVASESPVSVNSSNAGSADWEGRDTSFRPTVFRLSADEHFKEMMQLRMAEGRWFRTGSTVDQHNFILNETAARDFGLRAPVIGRRFSFQGDTGQIIGIVKDFHFASLHTRISDLVIVNQPTRRYCIFVRTQPGKTAQALAAAKSVWQRYVPQKPFDYVFQDDEFNQFYKDDARLSTMIRLFSAVAIFISSLGLFGLVAFAAEQRTKELGIRKLLGATAGSLVALLSADFLRLVLLSIAIASPVAAWIMHEWLQDFAYHVPLSGWIFLLAGALAMLIAAATVSLQAISAARSNPVKNLRIE